MNFDDTPQEAAFRATVRTWIMENAPHHLAPELQQAKGTGMVGVHSEDPLAASRAWQARKAASGYACLHWPKEYGGGGFTPMQRVIWLQEEGCYTQLGGLFSIGHGMCGPTLMGWAGEDAKRRLLPPMATGADIWCQLFSEPAAGSDLAGLRTSALRTEDGWVVNGQKVWTSAAQYARYGLLLARTDPTVPKHKGLTMFYLDMTSPGIEIRPIRQANGASGFNEVFFSDVCISDSQRLGHAGQGWEVSLTTLMNERQSIGAAITTGFDEVFAYACRSGAVESREVRARLARWAVRDSGLKYTSMRAITALSRGDVPGPENAIGKLVAGAMKQEIAAFAMDLQGAAGMVTAPGQAALDAVFQAILMRAPAMRVEGGSDEILRNVIAERVLGLPGDVRVDKNIPFNEIPLRGNTTAMKLQKAGRE